MWVVKKAALFVAHAQIEWNKLWNHFAVSPLRLRHRQRRRKIIQLITIGWYRHPRLSANEKSNGKRNGSRCDKVQRWKIKSQRKWHEHKKWINLAEAFDKSQEIKKGPPLAHTHTHTHCYALIDWNELKAIDDEISWLVGRHKSLCAIKCVSH